MKNLNITLCDAVTVTATPDEGRTFIYWQDEKGSIVSYDAEYSFTVTGETKLTAVCIGTDANTDKPANTGGKRI